LLGPVVRKLMSVAASSTTVPASASAPCTPSSRTRPNLAEQALPELVQMCLVVEVALTIVGLDLSELNLRCLVGRSLRPGPGLPLEDSALAVHGTPTPVGAG
jgi:hypothetical protein